MVALGRVVDLHPLEAPLGLFLVLGQLVHGVPDRVHRGVGTVERDEDEPIAELPQLPEGQGVGILVPAERRGVVERQRQARVRLLHGSGELDGRSAVGAGQLAPDQVHTRVGVCAPTPDRLFHAAPDRAVGVGAGDDDEVTVEPVALGQRGAVLPERLLPRHDGLARDVAAPLGEALILQVKSGGAGLDELLHRPHGREGVAVAIVGVGDHRDLHRARHHRGRLGDLRHRQEPHVGPAIEHGDGVAAQVNGLHPRALGDLGVERGVDATREQIRLILQKLAELLAH